MLEGMSLTDLCIPNSMECYWSLVTAVMNLAARKIIASDSCKWTTGAMWERRSTLPCSCRCGWPSSGSSFMACGVLSIPFTSTRQHSGRRTVRLLFDACVCLRALTPTLLCVHDSRGLWGLDA